MIRDAVGAFLFNVSGRSDLEAEGDELARILVRAGYDDQIDRLLGSGTFGTAFLLKDGRVLKLTSDPQEAQGAAHIMDHPHPNFVRIYDVFQLGDVVASNWRLNVGPMNIYAIVQEQVDTDLDVLTNATLRRETKRVKETHKVWPEDIMGLPRVEAQVRLAAAQDDLIAKYRDSLDDRLIQVADGIEHLRSLGILTVDFHPGNVGRIDDTIKLFDPGVAVAPPRRVRAANPHWYAQTDVRVADAMDLAAGVLRPIPIRIEE